MFFLYLIKEVPLDGEVSGPWTKIGITGNPPAWRLDANLKRGNPRVLSIHAVFQFEDRQAGSAAEQLAHAHFGLGPNGKEWVNASGSKIEAWLKAEGYRLQKMAVIESNH